MDATQTKKTTRTNRFSKIRQPFKCADCGKLTTGPEGTDGPELCGPCYDFAGWENSHSDNAHGQDNRDPECLVCQKATVPAPVVVRAASRKSVKLTPSDARLAAVAVNLRIEAGEENGDDVTAWRNLLATLEG